MQFSIALVVLSALVGNSAAELCSCFTDILQAVRCCDQITNFETWNGYECGVTSAQVAEFNTCCETTTHGECRDG